MNANRLLTITGHRLPTIKSCTLAAGILLTTLCAGVSFAQDTNTAPPAVQWNASDAVRSLLTYIENNASTTAGYAWNMDGSRGVLLKQGLAVVTLKLRHTETKLEICHATFFQDPAAESVNQEQVGLGVTWRWFPLPPVVQQTVDETPVVRKLVFFPVNEIRISPYIGIPVENIANMTFDYHQITMGISAGVRF